MIEVSIVKATIADIDTLMYWRMHVLSEMYHHISSDILPVLEKANRMYYEEALSNGTHIACFAKIGDEIVGCGGLCLQREMPSLDNINGESACLMNIYIVPKYRHIRIGHDIVSWLIREAESLTVSKIYLETSKAARSLYESMGFIDMNDMMKFKD